MLTDKVGIKRLRKYLKDNDVVPNTGHMICVQDLPEERIGNIVLSDSAKSEPHSAVIVAVSEDLDPALVGTRIMYRPFTPHCMLFGLDSKELYGWTIHYKDVLVWQTKV